MVGGEAPQELMKGWGRPPIRKASNPYPRLGIQATLNLAKEGKKGRVVVIGRPAENA